MTKEAISHGRESMLLDNYDVEEFFDEMLSDPKDVRRHYAKFVQRFGTVGPDEFNRKRESIDLAFLRQGITFNVYGDSQGTERIFPFDLVPRIIPAAEWEHIEVGLVQRITALNLFLHDIYH